MTPIDDIEPPQAMAATADIDSLRIYKLLFLLLLFVLIYNNFIIKVDELTMLNSKSSARIPSTALAVTHTPFKRSLNLFYFIF